MSDPVDLRTVLTQGGTYWIVDDKPHPVVLFRVYEFSVVFVEDGDEHTLLADCRGRYLFDTEQEAIAAAGGWRRGDAVWAVLNEAGPTKLVFSGASTVRNGVLMKWDGDHPLWTEWCDRGSNFLLRGYYGTCEDVAIFRDELSAYRHAYEKERQAHLETENRFRGALNDIWSIVDREV